MIIHTGGDDDDHLSSPGVHQKAVKNERRDCRGRAYVISATDPDFLRVSAQIARQPGYRVCVTERKGSGTDKYRMFFPDSSDVCVYVASQGAQRRRLTNR